MTNTHWVNEKECEAAGLDPKQVARIASRLAKVAVDAEKLGLQIFGGAHSGSLRDTREQLGKGQGRLVCAYIGCGSWDGGDGGAMPGDDGLERGE